MLAGLGLGFTTIALFVYVLLTPLLMGVEPDVCGTFPHAVFAHILLYH